MPGAHHGGGAACMCSRLPQAPGDLAGWVCHSCLPPSAPWGPAAGKNKTMKQSFSDPSGGQLSRFLPPNGCDCPVLGSGNQTCSSLLACLQASAHRSPCPQVPPAHRYPCLETWFPVGRASLNSLRMTSVDCCQVPRPLP